MKIKLKKTPANTTANFWICSKEKNISQGTLKLPAGMTTRPINIMHKTGVPDYVVNLDQLSDYECDERERVAGGMIVREANRLGFNSIQLMLEGCSEELFSRVVTGVLLATYRYTAYTSNDNASVPASMTIVIGNRLVKFRKILRHIQDVNTGITTARDLANTPASDMPPKKLAEFAKNLAKEHGLGYQSLSLAQLKKGKYVGLVNVGRGSANPPVLFALKYQPEKRKKESKPLCLVGKGITFDAGGINLKPFQDMWLMKGDMGGAATVIGAMHAIALIQPNTEITGIVAAAQNMPDGNSFVPSDVLTYNNGVTVEIQNTDAEGRLVLADALIYAQRSLHQKRIVDFATLTGACARALGPQYIGMMSRAEELKRDVLQASISSEEPVWELPMAIEYRKLLKSSVADIRNIGGPIAGAQTAAWYLQHFIEKQTEYVHLDIAGTFTAAKEDKYWSHAGMTGSGVRLAIALAISS